MGRTNGVDDLIHVKKCDTEPKNKVPAPGMIAGENQHREDQQVSESLRVLRTVNRAYAEGKESGKNARDRRIRTRSGRCPRGPARRDRWGIRDRWRYKCRRRRSGAFQ